MTTNELVRINKDVFIKIATSAASSALFTTMPFINFPPVNLLINQGINWLVGKIADGLELSAFFIYVDFRVDAQRKDYVNAAHAANNSDDEELRKIADEKFKVFVHFNNY